METGTITKDNGKFGFIKPDSGAGPEMFVMPAACVGFGGAIPPLYTQVQYSIVQDEKTGRPRAHDVGPVGGGGGGFQADPYAAMGGWQAPAPVRPIQLGKGAPVRHMEPHGGKGGWGAPQAQKGGWGGAPAPMWSQGPQGGQRTGTMLKGNGKFGFVQQDSPWSQAETGEGDMFIMPAGCQAFGGQLPEEGTRLLFDIVLDSKTGKVRADNVQPCGQPGGIHLGGASYGPSSYRPAPASYGPSSYGPYGAASQAPPMHFKGHGKQAPMQRPAQNWAPRSQAQEPIRSQGVLFTYSWEQEMQKSLVIELEEQRIHMGIDEEEWQQRLQIKNSLGSMLQESHLMDAATEDQFPMEVKLLQAGQGGGSFGEEAAQGDLQRGTMATINGSFGFLKQDSGEGDMFIMPAACKAFGGQLPGPGSRLMYRVVFDQKTGRPRAEDVVPEDQM